MRQCDLKLRCMHIKRWSGKYDKMVRGRFRLRLFLNSLYGPTSPIVIHLMLGGALESSDRAGKDGERELIWGMFQSWVELPQTNGGPQQEREGCRWPQHRNG